jgi:hypothetical protein
MALSNMYEALSFNHESIEFLSVVLRQIGLHQGVAGDALNEEEESQTGYDFDRNN